MKEFLQNLMQAPIVPTVFPLSAEVLGAYIDVLAEENYPALEILCRPWDEAFEVFRQIAQTPQRQRIALGLGTMLTETAAREAVRLKPDFLVSPAFSRKILHVAAGEGIPYIPAVCTFQDVQDVLDAFEEEGLTVSLLKLCPILHLTTEYVRMLAGCFPGIRYCPTGEVTMENYAEWKASPHIAAPMGSRFVPREFLENRRFDQVRARLQELKTMQQAGDPS